MINIKVDKPNKLNGEYSLFVTFPYNTNIVDIMRSFPCKWYNIDKYEWELPYNYLDKLKEQLQSYELNIVNLYENTSNLTDNRRDI